MTSFSSIALVVMVSLLKVSCQIYLDYVEEWSLEDFCDDEVKGTVISNETLYVVCEKDGIFALDMNGTTQWTLNVGEMKTAIIVRLSSALMRHCTLETKMG